MEDDRPGGRPPARYLGAATCGRISLEMVPTGLVLDAAVLGHGTGVAARTIALFTATSALTAPVMGAWTERAARPTRWYRAGAVTAAMAYLLLAGGPLRNPIDLAVGAVLAGLAQPLLSTAWSSYLSRLVGPRLPRASAWDVATYCAGSAVGPVVASLTVLVDPKLPLLVAAVLALCGGAATIGLRVPAVDHGTATTRLQAVVQALPMLLRRRDLRRYVVVGVAVQFCAASLALGVPDLARRSTGSLGTAGAIGAGLAVGALVSSLLRGTRAAAIRVSPAVLAASFGGLLLALVGATNVYLIVGVLLLLGSINGVVLAEIFRLIPQEVTGPHRAPAFAIAASLRVLALSVGLTVLSVPALTPTDRRFLVVGPVMLAIALAVAVGRGAPRHGPSSGTAVASSSTVLPLVHPVSSLLAESKERFHVSSNERPVIAVAHQSIGDEPFVRALIGDRAEVRYGPLTSDAEAAALSEGADAVIVTLQPLPASRLAALAPTVRVIGRAGVGLDTIDLTGAQEAGISVVHEPTYATNEVATHAAALLLAVHRRLPQAAALVADGWGLVSTIGSVPDLSEATLGLVGFGHIGRAAAVRMAPFVARVVYYDPAVPDGHGIGTPLSSLDEVLAVSDLLSLHVPLIPQTRGIIGAAELARMRRGSVLVNVSRGGLVDEGALADALRSGHLGGAGLDVFATEPLPDDSPLRDAPNLLMTPHVAWFSDDASDRMAGWTVDDVLAYLSGDEPPHGRLAVRADPSAVRA